MLHSRVLPLQGLYVPQSLSILYRWIPCWRHLWVSSQIFIWGLRGSIGSPSATTTVSAFETCFWPWVAFDNCFFVSGSLITMKCHGCLLLPDGARHPVSRIRFRSGAGIMSCLNFRILHRFSITSNRSIYIYFTRFIVLRQSTMVLHLLYWQIRFLKMITS